MGSDVSKMLSSCLNRDNTCEANCPDIDCYYCCNCKNGDVSYTSHISEDEEETETDKRRSNVRRRSSEN